MRLAVLVMAWLAATLAAGQPAEDRLARALCGVLERAGELLDEAINKKCTEMLPDWKNLPPLEWAVCRDNYSLSLHADPPVSAALPSAADDRWAALLVPIDTKNAKDEEFTIKMGRWGEELLWNVKPDRSYEVRAIRVQRAHATAVVTTGRMRSDPPATPLRSPPELLLPSADDFQLTPGVGLSAKLGWTRAPDDTCSYAAYYSCERPMISHYPRIVSPGEARVLRVSGLLFDTACQFTVMALSANRKPKRTVGAFRTPACTNMLSPAQCPPERPANLSARAECMDNVCVVNVDWTKPALLPDSYNLTIVSRNGLRRLPKKPTISYPAWATAVQIENVTLDTQEQYVVLVDAISTNGRGRTGATLRPMIVVTPAATTTVAPVVTTTPAPAAPLTVTWPIWVVVLAFIGTLVVAVSIGVPVVSLWLSWRREVGPVRRRPKPNDDDDISEEDILLEDVTATVPLNNGDRLKFLESAVRLHEIMGKGEFGLVRRGVILLQDQSKTVAVKMLKERSGPERAQQLSSELEVMRTVGSHPQVLGLVGYVSGPDGGVRMLLTEYCARGDLLRYLRASWRSGDGVPLSNRLSICQQVVRDSTHEHKLGSFAQAFWIRPCVLSQVARGMAHLAACKVVHRDLAARNVLVCEDYTVKIADFGLSRDVYQYGQYTRRVAKDPLPIKWMALESLTRNIYTTQSDVWSFGVLLWEMATLGAVPYPEVEPLELAAILATGYRMPCPPQCAPELYAVMLACWRTEPNSRPTFRCLEHNLDNMLAAAASDYLSLRLPDEVAAIPPTPPPMPLVLGEVQERDHPLRRLSLPLCAPDNPPGDRPAQPRPRASPASSVASLDDSYWFNISTNSLASSAASLSSDLVYERSACSPPPSPTPPSSPTPQPSSTPSSSPTTLPSPTPPSSPTALPSPTPPSSPTPQPSSTPPSSPTALPSPTPPSSPTALHSPTPPSSPTALPSSTPPSTLTALPSPTPPSSPTALHSPTPPSSSTALPSPTPPSSLTALPSPTPPSSPTPLPSPTPPSSPTPQPSSVASLSDSPWLHISSSSLTSSAASVSSDLVYERSACSPPPLTAPTD